MDSLEEWLSQPEGLGAGLRALRVQAGLTGKQLADANGWAQSKVSRLETGQQMPSDADIEAWAAVTGASAETVRDLAARRDEARVFNATFKLRARGGQAQVQRSYADLAAASTLIRHFEMTYVPGPLQIPEYAREVFTRSIGLHEMEVDDVDAAVAERLRRGQMIYTEPGKQWEFLIAEPVLHWLICPREIMQAQLDRLQTVIGLPRVRFGIIPMSVPLTADPQNTVEVYVGTETVAVAETFIGETWHRDEEAAKYMRALDRAWTDAAEGDHARHLVMLAAEKLRGER